MPAVSSQDAEAIRQIASLGLNARIYTFARALKTDIDMALECGAHGVIIEVPIGYPKLVTQFGWTWEDVFKKSRDVINYARECGLHTVFFPYDTTRARPKDLRDLCTAIMNESVPDSIGIVDTMGCATPEAIKYLVKWVKELTGLPIEIHTHNDFGNGGCHRTRCRFSRGGVRSLVRKRAWRANRKCGIGGTHPWSRSALWLRNGLQA